MLKHSLIFTLMILLPFSVFADGNEALFEAANQNYANEEYEEAINGYEQILQTGQESAEVYYNLGNAYFKTSQVALAILNYERGLLLEPGDEDIEYNLAIANELITDKIDEIPTFFLVEWVQSVKNSLSANSWAWLSLLFFSLMGTFVVLFVLFKRRALKTPLLAGIIILIALSISSFLFSRDQAARISGKNTAIVFAPSVTTKSSPDTSGNDLFILHEGSKVELLDNISGWYEIRIADGNIAWIPSDAVQII